MSHEVKITSHLKETLGCQNRWLLSGVAPNWKPKKHFTKDIAGFVKILFPRPTEISAFAVVSNSDLKYRHGDPVMMRVFIKAHGPEFEALPRGYIEAFESPKLMKHVHDFKLVHTVIDAQFPQTRELLSKFTLSQKYTVSELILVIDTIKDR